MAEKRTTRAVIAKKRTVSTRKQENTISSTINNFLRFTESYTSLLLGIIVVILAAVLLLSFFRNRTSPMGGNPGDTSSTATGPNISTGKNVYVVQQGDDLWSIAQKKYNDGYRWVEIAKANNLGNGNSISAGTKLVLPKLTSTPTPTVTVATVTSVASKGATISPAQQAVPQPSQVTAANKINGATYTVVKGDDLWDISIRAYGNGYKWVEIARVNNLANPNVIHSGNVLKLPR